MHNEKTTLIRLTLIDGDPDGLRSVSIAGRTTVLTACPLAHLSILKERDEAKRPAIYFLIGNSVAEAQEDAIYIGECDALADRFRSKHHALDKAEWREVVLASTTDETFNKAHARRAEHMLVERARNLQRAEVLTDQTSPGKLSDGDAAFAANFVADVTLLSEVLGVAVFRGRLLVNAIATPVSERLITSLSEVSVAAKPGGVDADGATFKFVGARELSARLRVDGSGFLLLSGSQARAQETTACPPSVSSQRRKARALGALVVDGSPDRLRFDQDFPVQSTSSAAGILSGTSLRGPHMWKHEESGEIYADWIAKRQSGG